MVSIIILYYNVIILWDHRRICGQSLTETSLCGAYLYSVTYMLHVCAAYDCVTVTTDYSGTQYQGTDCCIANGLCSLWGTNCEKNQDGTSWFCSQAVSKPIWHIPLLCVQWNTPDDGQRNCPKHVECYSKNTFEKLVHLAGFIIRMKFHKYRSGGNRDVSCGRTDRQTDMTQLIVALRNYSTAPTKVEQYFTTITYRTVVKPRVTAGWSDRNFKVRAYYTCEFSAWSFLCNHPDTYNLQTTVRKFWSPALMLWFKMRGIILTLLHVPPKRRV